MKRSVVKVAGDWKMMLEGHRRWDDVSYDRSGLLFFKSAFIIVCTYIFATVYLSQESVYIYYGLTNYYQNHRRYVRSRDDNQLHGEGPAPGKLIDDCDPYRTTTINKTEYGYAPCGAIANSLFNGKLFLSFVYSHLNYTTNFFSIMNSSQAPLESTL